MMVFSVSEFIRCIKFRAFREQGIIQQADLDDGFHILVDITSFQVIKYPAEIAERALSPVVLVADLHFKMDDGTVIEGHFDIEKECLCIDGSAQLNRIQDIDGDDLFVMQMEKGAD